MGDGAELDRGQVDRAREAALRLLKARDRTRSALGVRLRAKGFEAGVVEHVLDRLEAVELLDERATAERLVRTELRKGAASGRLLRSKLFKEGVSGGVAEEVVAGALEGVDLEYAAEEEARRWLERHGGLDRETAARRLAGRLARRGFDGEVVRVVVRKVLED